MPGACGQTIPQTNRSPLATDTLRFWAISKQTYGDLKKQNRAYSFTAVELFATRESDCSLVKSCAQYKENTFCCQQSFRRRHSPETSQLCQASEPCVSRCARKAPLPVPSSRFLRARKSRICEQPLALEGPGKGLADAGICGISPSAGSNPASKFAVGAAPKVSQTVRQSAGTLAMYSE